MYTYIVNNVHFSPTCRKYKMSTSDFRLPLNYDNIRQTQLIYLLIIIRLANIIIINPSNAELNPICHLLALLGAHHIFHVSGLRFNE